MKLTKKNRSALALLIVLGLVIGTLGWEIIERLVELTGRSFDLSVGPVGFDLHVLAVTMRLNPGSFVGTIGGVLLFVRI